MRWICPKANQQMFLGFTSMHMKARILMEYTLNQNRQYLIANSEQNLSEGQVDKYFKLVKKLDKLDFDIYYINLYLDDVSKFEERLNRSGKALYKYAPFKIESSIKQQETYCQMSDELKKITKNINVIDFNVNRPVEEEYEELNKLLGIESKK